MLLIVTICFLNERFFNEKKRIWKMKHNYNYMREYTSNNALYLDATPNFATRSVSKGKLSMEYLFARHLAIRTKLYHCSIILFETINAT